MEQYGLLITLLLYGCPIVLMLYMAIEIIQRDRNILNRISSGIFMCMFFILTGSFFVAVFPADYVPMFFICFMMIPAFALVGLAVHFTLRLTSRHDYWPRWKVMCVCYLQSALVLVLLLPTRAFYVDSLSNGMWKSVQPSPAIFHLIMIPALYTLAVSTCFMIKSYRYVKQRHMLQKEKQLRFIFWGLSIGGLFDIGLSGFNHYLIFSSTIHYPEPSTLGIIFFAVMIRYAIIRYEFLPSVEHKYKILFKRSPIAILLVNAKQQVMEANPAAHRLFDKGSAYFLRARLRDLLQPYTYTGSDMVRYDRVDLAMTVLPQGKERIVMLEKEQVSSGGEAYEFMMLLDITDNIWAQQDIAHLASHDALTDLANRRSYQDALSVSLQSLQERSGEGIAVILLDLDRFKQINDTKGHRVGDLLLQHVADQLRCCGEEACSIARLGGDEFALLYRGRYTPEDMAEKCRHILEGFGTSFAHEGERHEVTASIGVCMTSDAALKPELLMQYADLAMYESKRKGRNRFEFYTEELKCKEEARLTLERKLREALEHEEFTLYYQPQIDVLTGRVIGAEALVRWKGRCGTLASPGDFIPVLEESGLIIPFGHWLLREACQYGARWLDSGLPEMTFSVNVSNRELLHPQYLEEVEAILEATGFPPQLLRIEITESVITSTEDHVKELFHQLRKKGIRLSIDDFGTGYSTFSSLQSGLFQQFKLDCTIIRDIHKCQTARTIVSAMIAMARSLDLHIVAEGVEEREQLMILQESGCHAVQGYLYSPPLAGSQFEAWVRAGLSEPNAVS